MAGRRAAGRPHVRHERGRRAPTPGGRSAARSWLVAVRCPPPARRPGAGRAQVISRERACDRQRRIVLDVHDGETAMVGDRPQAVHSVSARHAQARFEDRCTQQSLLAHRDFRCGAVPPIIGGDVPVEGRRAVPRFECAVRRDVRSPRLTKNSSHTVHCVPRPRRRHGVPRPRRPLAYADSLAGARSFAPRVRSGAYSLAGGDGFRVHGRDDTDDDP